MSKNEESTACKYLEQLERDDGKHPAKDRILEA